MFVIPGKDFAPEINTLTDSTNKLMINSLLTNLRFATNSTNIDAWCDLLSDNSMLNTGASSGYTLSGGQFTPTSGTVGIAITSTASSLGYIAANAKIGFVFTPTFTGNMYNVKLNLKKIGSPTDNIVVKLYATSAGLPTTVIATSVTTLAGTSLTTNYVQYDFTFNTTVTANTVYAIVIERSGDVSTTNYYASAHGVGGSGRVKYDGSTWVIESIVPDGIVYIQATATVVWKVTTATEVLTRMAVVADQTLNTGTITWYVSHNGTDWTQITALSTVQNVNFTGTSVYLKCIATSDSVVKAVAWGGL